MAEALSVHAEVCEGPDGHLVGPFLCPVGRLNELDACVAGGVPRPERIGVVLYAGDKRTGRAVSQRGVVQVEGPLGVTFPSEAMRLRKFLELPPVGDVDRAVASVAASQASAKVRCGGSTPDQVPSVERLADVLLACAKQGVRLKATAGLHHPVRHRSDGTGAVEHGFLNLLAAASAVVGGAGRAEVLEVLQADGEGAANGLFARIDRRSRELITSIGTCSLSEPIGALHELGLAA